MTVTSPTVKTPTLPIDDPHQSAETRQENGQTPINTLAKNEQTFGEKKFHNRYYGNVGFWANLGLSSLITYFVNENSKGAGLKNLLDKNFYQNTLKISHAGTRSILTKATTLLMGGHITAGAIYFAEKDKSNKVRKWDEEHYGPNAEADPTIKAAHDRVDAEGKVNGWGMAVSRMLCWGAIQVVALVGGDKNKNLIKDWATKKNLPKAEYYSVERPSEMFGTAIAQYTPAPLKKGFTAILSPLADEHKKAGVYQKVMEYAAMDTIYTAVTAWMLKPVTTFVVDHVPFLRKSSPTSKNKPHVNMGGFVGTSAADTPSVISESDTITEKGALDKAAPSQRILAETALIDSTRVRHEPLYERAST